MNPCFFCAQTVAISRLDRFIYLFLAPLNKMLMPTTSKNNYTFPIIVIGVLFFVFGFITWANSQLIPYLKLACQLTETQSYYVGSAFFAAYFVMSIPSSYILKWVGFKRGMAVGLFVMAAGALLFIPAAEGRNYPLFLTGLFIIGSGLALLQTASNPYVTILGPIESAAQRISIMGICNKFAGICAVYVLGYIMLKDGDQIEASLLTMPEVEKNALLQSLAERVVTPYVIIAIALVVLGVVLLFIKLPEVKEEENDATVNHNTPGVFSHRNLVLGAVAIFFYVGAEVISYDAFTTFGKSIGYSVSEAKSFASYTGYALLVGYFLGIILIPKYIGQRKALIGSSILSVILVIVALVSTGTVAVVAFALLGFSQAVMWPAIWPLALNGLGKHTKLAGAILVMMIVGGAIMLPLMGFLAEAIGSHKNAFAILIPCYLFLLFYGTNGYKSKYMVKE